MFSTKTQQMKQPVCDSKTGGLLWVSDITPTPTPNLLVVGWRTEEPFVYVWLPSASLHQLVSQ